MRDLFQSSLTLDCGRLNFLLSSDPAFGPVQGVIELRYCHVIFTALYFSLVNTTAQSLSESV